MAAYRRVHDSRHLQADCQEPVSAPEPYAELIEYGLLYLYYYIFQPFAIETLGPLNASALNLLSEVGRRLTSLFGVSRKTSFLFQRLSMHTALQLCSDHGLLLFL